MTQVSGHTQRPVGDVPPESLVVMEVVSPLPILRLLEQDEETEQLMLEAMAENLALLRELGQPVPEPADSASVTILDPAAA